MDKPQTFLKPSSIPNPNPQPSNRFTSCSTLALLALKSLSNRYKLTLKLTRETSEMDLTHDAGRLI